MTATVNDLQAVRPICALCCCAFCATLPCYQMTCFHMFCEYCLPENACGQVFKCPFDNITGQVYPFSAEVVATVENVIANQMMYASGAYGQQLAAIYSTLSSNINFNYVPCRYFTRTGACHPGLTGCPYDHGNAGFITSSQCLKGANCHRGEFCPYQHPMPVLFSTNTPPPMTPSYMATTSPFVPNVVMTYPGTVQPAPQSSVFTFHREPAWYHTVQPGQAAVVPLQQSDQVYREVSALFLQTAQSHTILRVDEIRNKQLYTKFAFRHESYSQTEGRSLQIMRLFHGSGATAPSSIYNSAVGIDARLCTGPWGKGSHFTRSAAYATYSAHKLSDGSHQLLCCVVIIGDCWDFGTKQDKTLTRPPKKKGTETFFHSVKGSDKGADIYATYEPEMSYPSYVITYR